MEKKIPETRKLINKAVPKKGPQDTGNTQRCAEKVHLVRTVVVSHLLLSRQDEN